MRRHRNPRRGRLAQLKVRMPHAKMLVALRRSAKANQISLNAEIVGRLAISLAGENIERRLRRIEALLERIVVIG
jgi:hypothetical protein